LPANPVGKVRAMSPKGCAARAPVGEFIIAFEHLPKTGPPHSRCEGRPHGRRRRRFPEAPFDCRKIPLRRIAARLRAIRKQEALSKNRIIC